LTQNAPVVLLLPHGGKIDIANINMLQNQPTGQIIIKVFARLLLRLPVGKVDFACYSISSRSSLICLAWEQYKLAQVLNSNLISE